MTCAAEPYRGVTRNGALRSREVDNTVVAIRQKPYSEARWGGRHPPQKGETLTIIGFCPEEPACDSRYQPQMQDDGSSGSNDNSQNTVIKHTLFREVLIERT
jgi:hypothetical protein